MRKISLLLILISAISLQSCLDVVEILTLKKNGSGTYQLEFDMSGLVNNPMMKEMFMQSLEKEEAFADAFKNGGIELDTLIDMKDGPMAANTNKEMPAIMKKVKMRMQMSDSQGIFKSTMSLNFDDTDEIAEFYKALEESGGEGAGPGLNGMVPSNGLFEFKKRTITRKNVQNKALAEADGEAGEMMEMMKMMMGSAKFTSIYNLPKKPKKVDFANAKVDGKTVTVTHSYLDIMDGKANLGGSIKY